MWADQVETWQGEEYAVRRLTGAASRKPYRCPGCDQQIPTATPHIVVWPAHDTTAEHRRHWHAACWRARDRRSGKIHRARNAPHYG